MGGLLLKPVIFVMGGVRAEGERKRSGRHTTRRRSRLGKNVALEFNVIEKTVVAEPAQWRAARRFVKNSNQRLKNYYVATKLGHVALKSMIPALRNFREKAMHEAAYGAPGRPGGNATHKEWQVLVELTWADLGDDARSMLLSLYAEDLPPSFFKRAP